ncbi:MAG: acyl-CoA thioesterase [Methylobacteriaceae bacterium]|nr:acyl-CoA thioesterase [Rhodoblastus sp.]MCC0004156.1 acyl-CoA thioesterase [Methylobacteriaceae bacterium]
MTRPTFTVTRKIRFGHVDPAGIVYYPHYFDMFNGVVEDFFDDCVGASFQAMRSEFGVVTPLRNIEADFIAPCRIGDKLDLALTLVKVGRTSLRILIDGTVNGSPRLAAKLAIVFVSAGDGRAVEPPPSVQARLKELAAD